MTDQDKAAAGDWSFLAAGGAMGEMIAERDWSGAALGPVQGWPQSLRTALSICLSSRFPMLVWWGRELVQFYNDAFVPLMGNKHPAALGQPAAECWAEVWADVGPLADSVLAGQGATWSLDQQLFMQRHGYLEETYWTFSYSPIRDETGGVGGVFVVTTDTTTQVLGERRLRTLRELGELSTMSAGTAGQACRAAVAVLGRHREEVPFAMAYLRTEDSAGIRLVASSGVAAGVAIAGETLPPGDGGSALWRVANSGPAQLWTGLAERYPGVIERAAVGDAVPTDAVVLPLTVAGQPDPIGVLVAGVNPFRELDADYRSFFDLVAGHLCTAVTDALAYQAEHRRAEALAELDRAKTAFFSNISHEFRTPLALMMGPVAELRCAAGPVNEDRLRAELDVVHRNGLRLAKLVNTLLDFSRIQAGRIQAGYEPVDLAAATVDLASVFRSAMQRASLAFEVDCADLGEPVYVDRDMWEKVVLNLLSNALKFTFEGTVAVTVRRESDAAVLRVADTGTGIPAAELPRLFERFHRVEGARARSAEGSGIGLALTKELVELHGGTISADSTVNAGTTFTVTLPFGHAHLPADQVRPAAPSLSTEPSAGAEPFIAEALRWLPGSTPPTDHASEGGGEVAAAQQGRVLVADDNADMRDYLHRLLAGHYRVQVVGDGQAALAAAQNDPPDLLLSDVMMPSLDGIALVAALRADPATATVPVVLLSARAGQQAAVEGLAAGADDYLVKPFSAEELRARVATQVRLGRARRVAERRFRQMADSIPALIWVDAADAQRVFVNRAWTEFTGSGDPGVELGRRWRDRIHPGDQQRYDEARAAAAGQGVPFDLEYRLRRGDGRYRWVLDRGAPLGLPDHPGGYVGGCLDVDARYRERERQRLLAMTSAALDGETGVPARGEVLVRMLVAEGLADLAQVVGVAEGGLSGVVAVAGRTADEERLLTEVDGSWPLAQHVLAHGEPRLVTGDEASLSTAGPGQRALRRRLDLRSVALVPLVARGRVVGLLTAASTGRSPGHDAGDLALLTEIGQRAATALDNAVLFEREQQTNRRLELLQQATAALSAAATPVQVAATVVAQFGQLLGTSAVAMWELRETGSLEAVAFTGIAEQPRRDWVSIPLDASIPAADAARRREPVWLGRRDEWGRDYPHLVPVIQAYGYPSAACLPLVVAGRCLAVVAVLFTAERVLSHAERTAATALADLCAQALQRAGLLAAESAARRAAEEFGDVVGALSAATTPAEVAQVILGHAAELGAEQAVVVLRVGEHLEVLAASGGVAGAARPDGRRLPLDAAHPLAHAVRTGEPVWQGRRSELAGQDRGFTLDAPDAVALPAQVAVPLLVGGTTIGAIGLHFGVDLPALTADERATVRTAAGQCAQALDRARLHQTEHRIAETLQHSLLPSALPALDQLSLAAHYLPAARGSQAGGDWYDVLPLDGRRVAIAVGDVVGQGPAAAAVMGQLRSALAAYLLEGHCPGHALQWLNRYAQRIDGARAGTAVCLVLDTETGALRWARAGHPPPLVLDPDGAHRFLNDARGGPLGLSQPPPFIEGHATLTPGSSVLLYTDGLVERRGEVIDDGLDRLVAAAVSHASAAPAQLIPAVLEEALGGAEPADDVAVIVARLRPAPLHQRLAATPAQLPVIRRAVAAWAAAAALPEELLDDLQLTLGEAAANAVEHAYAGREPGELTYHLRQAGDGSVHVEVGDEGTWRPVPVDQGTRGRGLLLIRELGQHVTIDTAAGPGTQVRFTLPAPPLDPVRQPPGRAPLRGPAVSGDLAELRVHHGPDGQLRLQLCGELDLLTVGPLRATLLSNLAAATGPVTLDTREVNYLSSAGVDLLIEAANAAPTQVHLHVHPGTPAARVLALTGLDQHLPLTQQPNSA